MCNKSGDIKEWASKLSKRQLMKLVEELFDIAESAEMVRFPSDALAPYWVTDGEPLVAGQQTWADEE